MFYHLTLYPTALPSFRVDSRIGIDASEPSLDSSSGAPRGQGRLKTNLYEIQKFNHVVGTDSVGNIMYSP